jgi:bacteriorhodopsin
MDLWSVGTDKPEGVDELGEAAGVNFEDKSRYAELNLGVQATACDEAHNTRSSVGQTAIWVGFFGMLFTSAWLCFEVKFHEFKTPEAKSQMYMTCFVCMIACLAYLTMGSGHGISTIGDCNREFFYARYIDWLFTTPLMLFEIHYIAQSSEDTKMWLIGADITMVAAGLIGALIDGEESWYFFIFGMLAFVPIIYYLVGDPLVGSGLPDQRKKLYSFVAILTAVSWCGYPLAWALCEGTGSLSVDDECCLYTVLDITAKCFFGVVIMKNKHLLGAKEDSVTVAPPMDDYLAKNLASWGSHIGN